MHTTRAATSLPVYQQSISTVCENSELLGIDIDEYMYMYIHVVMASAGCTVDDNYMYVTGETIYMYNGTLGSNWEVSRCSTYNIAIYCALQSI